ncbi:hypothetical protein DFH27DRAFT_616860 [Peziza echinospora]|nr:hypothetical protein DFH27DRAFT_616860 [Peziza echinospora]
MRTGSNPTSRAKLSTGTLKGIKTLKILEPAGFDVLLSMVQAKVEVEMEQLSNSSIMRRQMKDFDPNYIANFSLQRLAQEQLREAPVLSTILRGLANIDVGETGEEVWDKEVEEREIEEGDRDRIGAIPRYSGGGGINRLAGNDESGDESGEEEMEKGGHVVMCKGAGGKRDLMVSTAVNILCYARNQQVNAFQGMSGYLGFTSNMPKRIQDSYHKIGLSV